MSALLRRNGKLPSCEPCRKSKLSCDHASPICGRCQKRKSPQSCTYHPAPMTGTKPATDEKIQSRTKRPRRDATNPPDQDGYPRPIQSPGGHKGPPPHYKQVDEVIHRHAPTPEAANMACDTGEGYLGPTSYGAVFRESQLLDGASERSSASPPATSTDPFGRPNGPCDLESPKHVAEGVAILNLLPNHSLACQLLERYYEVSDVFCHEQTSRRCHESMWSTYHDALHGVRSKERLEYMSKRLCKNAMSVSARIETQYTRLLLPSFEDRKAIINST